MQCAAVFQENTKLNNSPIDQLQARVGGFLKAKGLENLENPMAQLMRQTLQELNFVNLEDFEVQKEILNRLRERVKALEARVAELEGKPSGTPT